MREATLASWWVLRQSPSAIFFFSFEIIPGVHAGVRTRETRFFALVRRVWKRFRQEEAISSGSMPRKVNNVYWPQPFRWYSRSGFCRNTRNRTATRRALFACVLFANRINILEIFLVSFMQSAESQDGTTRADFLQRQIHKVEVGARTLWWMRFYRSIMLRARDQGLRSTIVGKYCCAGGKRIFSIKIIHLSEDKIFKFLIEESDDYTLVSNLFSIRRS